MDCDGQSQRAGEGADSRERMSGYGEGKRGKGQIGEGWRSKERSGRGGEKRARDFGRNRLSKERS